MRLVEVGGRDDQGRAYTVLDDLQSFRQSCQVVVHVVSPFSLSHFVNVRSDETVGRRDQ
jgi:hypothetical protein